MEPSLRGKSDANECNESSLSNCRVQLALSKKEGRGDFRKEIPFHGFLDTLLKLERWLPAEFFLQLSRVNSITHIVTLSVSYISDEIHILAFLSAEQKEKVRYSFQYPYFKPCLSLSSNQSASASSKLHLN